MINPISFFLQKYSTEIGKIFELNFSGASSKKGQLKNHLIILFLLFFVSSAAQDTLTTSNLPIVIINTNGQEIPDEPKIDVDMGIIYNGPGELNHINDPFNEYEGMVGIEIRGSTSQCFPKKSYGFETRDSLGNDLNVSLLGLPEESDFVLYAPYSDKSCIRNVLAYKLSESTGHYAPRTRYCELMINGVYMGIYVLIEKVKRDENRVDIPKMTEADTTGDNVTGGYIIQVGKYDVLGWGSPYNPATYYQCYYPKESQEQQLNYIHEWMDTFENTMKNLEVPDTSFYSIIDKTSFIDYILVNEISKNPDAYRKSTFLTKERDSNGGKLAAGPVWDYNLAFGNDHDFNSFVPENWIITDTIYYSRPHWWDQMFMHPVFYAEIKERWNYLRQGPFHIDAINGIIDSCATILEEPQQRNFLKWDILGVYIWPNVFVGETYEEEIDYLKSWTADRINWMDSLFYVSTPIYEEVNFQIRVYPNPFSEKLNLQISLPGASQIHFQIFSFSGQEIYSNSFQYQISRNANFDIPLNASELPAGIYFYSCTLSTGEVYGGKLIKSN
ncbi:MAG: spore coat protein CotH [Bacteroidetes bacterium]|nr:MAG: spore coat protein CotH [Bacteroidota bacterium]